MEPRLELLAAGMARLAEGERDVRIPPAGTGDNIDVVIDAFNAMADSLPPAGTSGQAQRDAAATDSLTALPNRAALFRQLRDTLERETVDGRSPALLLIGLEDFKRVNDLLGSHSLGDSILKEVSERLREAVPQNAFVARIGGTEFAVLLPGASLTEARQAAAEAARCVSKLIWVEGMRVQPRASIGIRPADRDLGAEEMFSDAETALQVAKPEEDPPVTVFDPMMRHARTMRRLMETELREAIAGDQLVLYFQPIVELATGRIKGAESLVRWLHPTRGLIMPDEFIPIAEEIEAIVELGQWVLDTAVRELARWRAEGIVEEDFAIHINLSATELQRLELVDEIRGTLKRHSLPARNLIIELTESAMVKGNELDRYTLMSLKRLGVGMEIDDFGTGYSSISYLRRLPIDRVKADRSLIGDLESDGNQQKFVTAIIQLVHACGLDTLFEGIETAKQAEYLKQAGCSAGQGYYFSRPVPSEDFVGLFKRAS